MGIKKTTEQYKEQLLADAPEYKCLEEYQGNKIKILHRHITCGHEWKIRPNNILNGQGCPVCGKKDISKMYMKTTDAYKRELKEKNPEFKCLEEYRGNQVKILHKHTKCGHEWKVSPNNMLNGQGCPMCKRKIKGGTKEYVQLLKEINPEFLLLEKYKNLSTPILHKHLPCDTIRKITPNNILNGCGCRVCMGKQKKTHENYIKQLKEKIPEYDVLETYNGSNIKIKHKHKVCGYEWEIAPNRLLRDKSCPCCSGKIRKDTEYYRNELKEKFPEYEVVGTYINNRTKILHKHITCGYEWLVRPHDILHGYGCPSCTSYKGERQISNILDNFKIKYESYKTFDDLFGTGGGKLSYDFYIESYNALVEFQGIQHYQPVDYFGGIEKFKIQQKHDELKRNYAKQNNYIFIEIPYLYFDNIKEILTSRLEIHESA